MNVCKELTKIIAKEKELFKKLSALDFEKSEKQRNEGLLLKNELEEIEKEMLAMPEVELEIRHKIGKQYGFQSVEKFSCGVTRAHIGHNVYFVKTSGKLLFEKPFNDASWFKDGYATVQNKKDDPFHIIDLKGKWHLKESFKHISTFCEGLAWVQKDDNKFYYINLDGEKFPQEGRGFDQAGNFSEGVAPVMRQGWWHYIDKTGERIGNERFLDANPFKEGAAVVARVMGSRCYVDHNFEKIVDKNFAFATDFSDGLASVKEYGQNCWSVINKNGETVRTDLKDPPYFSDDVMWVKYTDGRIFLLDKNLDVIFEEKKYIDCRSFNCGMASVKRPDGKWEIIDKSKNLVFHRSFDFAAVTEEGTIIVSDKNNDKDIYYLDKTGRRLFGKKQ